MRYNSDHRGNQTRNNMSIEFVDKSTDNSFSHQGIEIQYADLPEQLVEQTRDGLTALSGGDYFFRVTVDSNQVPVAPVLCIQDKHQPYKTKAAYQLAKLDTEAYDDHTTYGGIIPDIEVGGHYGIYAPNHGDGQEMLQSQPLVLDPYARVNSLLIEDEEGGAQRYSVVERAGVDGVERPAHPEIDPSSRVIYEAHIRNSTMNHPDVPEDLRGTYLGFVHEAHLEHLKKLGITTVELLPIFQFDSRDSTIAAGAENYWGYGSTSFFAPHPHYATEMSQQNPEHIANEVKLMIDVLHANDIEVVLDVVYNHTSDKFPFKTLDKSGYYHDDNVDYTGCGNCIDGYSKQGVEHIIDSLKYWANEVGVDGFRFDLAGALAKDKYGMGRISEHPLFKEIANDEVLGKKVLIVEPWLWGDIGTSEKFRDNGFEEWSHEVRDTLRKLWVSGEAKDIRHLSEIMAGLASGRDSGTASWPINFITAHDGFTLEDLVSYGRKHNEANGEENRDGSDSNYSNNFGVEGPTDDREILAKRDRAKRNLAATCLLAWGTPMVLGGDELSHTKYGNNNTWNLSTDDMDRREQGESAQHLHWASLNSDRENNFSIFMQNLIALRKQCHLYGTGQDMGDIAGSPIGEKGIDWLNKSGHTMTQEDWSSADRVFGMYSSGLVGGGGSMSILHYVNGGDSDKVVELPKESSTAGDYATILDTSTGEVLIDNPQPVSAQFILRANSQVVLVRESSRLPPDYFVQNEAVPSQRFVNSFKHANVLRHD